ncbi:hypothetical protein OS493_011561 [Desmophyllum pertusum]|uniref:Uncharacterized protein n=1 Tax=Desmophyllum pertusum TaxID=174260 RepID=A0A9X0CMX0_9CNID|nr:hypothetical protein OS493_011561 [Desmophyllum pertusum]
MPAGAEFDDEDSDGYEFGSVNSVKSAPAQFNTTRTVNNDRQFGKDQMMLILQTLCRRLCLKHPSQEGVEDCCNKKERKRKRWISKTPSIFQQQRKSAKRSNFAPNKSQQAEAKKAASSLAVEDLRVAVVKGILLQFKNIWMMRCTLFLMAACAVSENTQRIRFSDVWSCCWRKNARVNVYDNLCHGPASRGHGRFVRTLWIAEQILRCSPMMDNHQVILPTQVITLGLQTLLIGCKWKQMPSEAALQTARIFKCLMPRG